MKVLIVCSGNSGNISPFVKDQGDSLISAGIEIEYFLIKGKGAIGYLKNLVSLKKKIKKIKPQIVHAHYGLSGLLAGLQRKVPVVLTLHGTDVNKIKLRVFSYLASILAKKTIIVSSRLASKIFIRGKKIIPCGVDFSIFRPMDRQVFRKKYNLNSGYYYVLFSSHFANPVKNYELAKKAILLTSNPKIKLIELKGYDRLEVAELMNAVDLCLITSKSEGSPQFSKEAVACSCPIISVNVGDVKEQIEGVKNCFIVDSKPDLIAKKINFIVNNNIRLIDKIDFSRYDNREIVKKLILVYKKIFV